MIGYTVFDKLKLPRNMRTSYILERKNYSKHIDLGMEGVLTCGRFPYLIKQGYYLERRIKDSVNAAAYLVNSSV